MLRYNGKDIIPAPFVSYKPVQDRTEDGTKIGAQYEITVRGRLVPWKGSPFADGTFSTITSGYPADDTAVRDDYDKRLTAILAKQKALTDLFQNNPGSLFEVMVWDGGSPLTCYPTLVSLEFPEGLWVEYCDFVITLVACELYLGGVPIGADASHVQRAEDAWEIQPGDELARTYQIRRTVSAQGKTHYASGAGSSGTQSYRPWEYASGYVLNVLKLGLKPARQAASGVLNLFPASGWNAYDYRRQQSLSELAGTFSVTETWTAFLPTVAGIHAMVDYVADVREGIDDGGLTRVSINGQVRGFEERDNTTFLGRTTKYQNALSGWNNLSPTLPSLANGFAGLACNPATINRVVGYNPTAGVVTFNYEYDNRPTPAISGAKSCSITVTNRDGVDVFAEIPVIGRGTLGPILQNVNLTQAKRRTVQIEALMPAQVYGGGAPSEPNTDALVASYAPGGTVFVDDNTRTFTDKGRYSRTTSWVYG
jgi:hypothetical protein